MSETVVLSDPDQPHYYTFQEALRVLNVSDKTLRKAIKEGRIPYIEVGPGAIRIPVDGLRDLWASKFDEAAS